MKKIEKKNIHSNIEGKMVVNEKSYKNTPNDEKMIRIVVAIVIIPGTAVLRMYKKNKGITEQTLLPIASLRSLFPRLLAAVRSR